MFHADQDLYPDLSSRAGMEPGEMVFVGEKRQEHSTLTIMRYNADGLMDEQILTDIETVIHLAEHNKKGITWINLNGLQNTTWIKRLGEIFEIHPLTLENILNTNQRPKLDEFTDSLFLEMNMLTWQADTKEIITEQLSVLVKKGVLITFQEVDGDVFENLRQNIRDGNQRVNRTGSDYLMYAILDAVVDHYFIVLENLSDTIEDLEDAITRHPDPAMLKSIHHFKRDLLFLRKSVWPLRELVNGLARVTSPLICPETMIYLRDVYDHSIQIMDIVETFRDMVSGILDIYLSSVSNQMNEVMKVLTIISTLFIPLTFITGLYGMNFENMPELRWEWGYFGVLGIMGVLLILMILYFRRKKWF